MAQIYNIYCLYKKNKTIFCTKSQRHIMLPYSQWVNMTCGTSAATTPHVAKSYRTNQGKTDHPKTQDNIHCLLEQLQNAGF